MSPVPLHVRLAARLTPAQRHVVLRCSDAEAGGRDHGFARSWPDVTAGRRHVSFSTVRALERLGIVAITERRNVRLTRLGLAVQLDLRQRERAGG